MSVYKTFIRGFILLFKTNYNLRLNSIIQKYILSLISLNIRFISLFFYYIDTFF